MDSVARELAKVAKRLSSWRGVREFRFTIIDCITLTEAGKGADTGLIRLRAVCYELSVKIHTSHCKAFAVMLRLFSLLSHFRPF